MKTKTTEAGATLRLKKIPRRTFSCFEQFRLFEKDIEFFSVRNFWSHNAEFLWWFFLLNFDICILRKFQYLLKNFVKSSRSGAAEKNGTCFISFFAVRICTTLFHDSFLRKLNFFSSAVNS